MGMNMLRQMNMAMDYIEAHLDQEIDVRKAARIACCSEHHFRRIFSFLAGLPLGEYIRRRRLTAAALDVTGGQGRVIDLAVKYGYDSPDSFTRAFQAFHGVTPTEARKAGAALKAFPPVTFHLNVKGGNEMQYRIVEKEAFVIAGIKKRITLVYEGVNPQMEDMWASLTESDFIELKKLSDTEPSGILCVSANFAEGREEGTLLDQYIGVASRAPVSGRWEILPVAAGTWAVFTAVGAFPEALQEVWAKIYSEWYPASGYLLAGGPEILWNEGKDTGKPDYKSEIWIPVQKTI